MPPAMEGSVRHCFIFLDRDRCVGTPHSSGSKRFGSCVRLAGERHSGAQPGAPANLPGYGASMTDFLTSLVERSFGTTGVIRPRVASLFEPLRNRAPHSDDVAEPREAGLSREEKPDSDVRHQPVEKHPAFALWDNRVGSPEVARTADGVPARAVPLPQEDSAPRPASVPADAALVQKNAFAALGFAPGLDSRRDSAPREQYPDGALAFPAAHSEAEAGVVRDASASPVVSPPSSKIAEGVVENVVENNERGLLV